MESQFMQQICNYISQGITSVDCLSPQQKYQLTVAYLREANLGERWEYIIEPPGCELLPQLLIEAIAQHKTSSEKEHYAKLALADTMVDAAVSRCHYAIEEGFSRAHADRYYWDSQENY